MRDMNRFQITLFGGFILGLISMAIFAHCEFAAQKEERANAQKAKVANHNPVEQAVIDVRNISEIRWELDHIKWRAEEYYKDMPLTAEREKQAWEAIYSRVAGIHFIDMTPPQLE